MKFKLALIFLAALFFGCSESEKVVINPEEDKTVVIAQIEKFHKLYNEEKFSEITDTIYHPNFLKGKRKERMLYQYRKFYDKFGKITKVNSVSDIQYYSNGASPKRYVSVWYNVNYENGSDFRELFMIALHDELKITIHRIHNNLDKVEIYD